MISTITLLLCQQLLCYYIDEILAEKTRTLIERNGRARDVYDVVNISRNFRSEINIDLAYELAKKKFEFKELEEPTVDIILEAIDLDVLRSNWEDQLSHQINSLPPVESYIDDRLHYQLSAISHSIYADIDHDENGLWHWVHIDHVLQDT